VEKPVTVSRGIGRPSEAIMDCWWKVFAGSFDWVFDDEATLLKCRDPQYVQRIMEASRNIADAAIDVFDERFRG
jgi:hypothetical protein